MTIREQATRICTGNSVPSLCPDFTAVKVSVVVQLYRSHAHHMSDFKAVSVVE